MSRPLEALATRLAGPDARVAVIGLGYVGLPLAVALAESGAHVIGIDLDQRLVAALAAGESHVGDVPSARLAAQVAAGTGRLEVRATTERLGEADAVVICVPTPLHKSKDPDISFIVAASHSVAEHARAGQLVVLESTTYPGTTEDVLVPLLGARGLVAGEHVAIAFSPERVDPGNPKYGLANTPKVVGGVTAACTAAATALYSRVCERIVPMTSPAAAETVKLLENTFRSVNIGLVNEFALICRRLGLDVWEIIEAAATKPFGFMSFKPGPGLGGHCIPVDPHYLAWKLRSLNFTARFIELADSVNSLMPEHVVQVVADALNEKEKALKGSRILALGVTYKKDVADVRESPALHVMGLLLAKGARVDFHDPLVGEVEVLGHALTGIELTDAALAGADCVVLLTDHSAFDPARIARESRLVVDTRNALAPALAADAALQARVRRI